MIIALWVVNALLALAFLAAGGMKATKSKEDLAAGGMAWTQDFSAGTIKAIGIAEVLGAIGLVAPLATGIAPVLTPIAATLLALVMVGAIAVHVRRQESYTPALALGALAAVSAVLGFLHVL